MTPRTAPGRSEGGFTLIELLMAISIMGISFVAILAALGTSVRSSEVHRTSADANAALVSAAETVKAADFTTPCAAAPAAYRNFLRANTPLPGTWATNDLDVTAVSCPSATVQMVTVSVTGPGTSVARTLTVAKSQRPSTLPTPTTTTTLPPGPPPASNCRLANARALRFGSTVLVIAIASPNQPTCPLPLEVRMSESTGSTPLLRLGWVWLNLIPDGGQCSDGSCSVVIIDGSDLVVRTIAVSG